MKIKGWLVFANPLATPLFLLPPFSPFLVQFLGNKSRVLPDKRIPRETSDTERRFKAFRNRFNPVHGRSRPPHPPTEWLEWGVDLLFDTAAHNNELENWSSLSTGRILSRGRGIGLGFSCGKTAAAPRKTLLPRLPASVGIIITMGTPEVSTTSLAVSKG